MVLFKYQNERTLNLVQKGEYHMSIYGYARISTKKQNIERQVRNILAVHPDAIIVREVYTGTKFQGRKELDKILKLVKPTDTAQVSGYSMFMLIYCSVSGTDEAYIISRAV